jgi:hypothetical protein
MEVSRLLWILWADLDCKADLRGLDRGIWAVWTGNPDQKKPIDRGWSVNSAFGITSEASSYIQKAFLQEIIVMFPVTMSVSGPRNPLFRNQIPIRQSW